MRTAYLLLLQPSAARRLQSPVMKAPSDNSRTRRTNLNTLDYC